MPERGWSYRYLRVDGLRVRVGISEAKSPSRPGERLLILNGIGASMEMLQPLIQSLPNLSIVAIDVPGTGRSSVPKRLMRLKGFAKIVAEVLDQLECPSVSVMGISWGGALAQEFAKRYPKRCKRLILAATLPGTIGVVPPKLNVLFRMSNPLRYWSPRYLLSIAPEIYGGSLRYSAAKAREYAKKMLPPSTLGYYCQIAAITGWSSLLWLKNLNQPTLVLAGNDDPIIPLVNARTMAYLIPNARLRIVECGHLFVLTQAVTLGPEIEAFLDGQGSF